MQTALQSLAVFLVFFSLKKIGKEPANPEGAPVAQPQRLLGQGARKIPLPLPLLFALQKQYPQHKIPPRADPIASRSPSRAAATDIHSSQSLPMPAMTQAGGKLARRRKPGPPRSLPHYNQGVRWERRTPACRRHSGRRETRLQSFGGSPPSGWNS